MICAICKNRMAQLICRRCQRRICTACHAGHGLCKICRQQLMRMP
ncbi:MAG: hypothetical protein ACXQTB_01270 [Candidatus Nezhaarchaeales archaeon]